MRLMLIFAVLITGCVSRHAPSIKLEIHPARIYESDEGGFHHTVIDSYVDVNYLDSIVREYVKQNNIEFDFRGTSGSYTVARERECLAKGWYGSGLGSPALSVEIGWDGQVKGHSIAIAVCGTGAEIFNSDFVDREEDDN